MLMTVDYLAGCIAKEAKPSLALVMLCRPRMSLSENPPSCDVVRAFQGAFEGRKLPVTNGRLKYYFLAPGGCYKISIRTVVAMSVSLKIPVAILG
jgi:hypothetical protein